MRRPVDSSWRSGLLAAFLLAGLARAEDPPAQKAPSGGKPELAAGVPTVDARDVVGLHLAGLAINPAQPRHGCPATVSYVVENRGLARSHANVEYRTQLHLRGRVLVDAPVPFLPPGGRIPFRATVSSAFGGSRYEAVLMWRAFSVNPVTRARIYGEGARLDLATLELGPLQSGPC